MQLEANRRNAQHSTGPRTPEGKAAVGQRHQARAVGEGQIVSMAKLGEPSEEFEQMLDEFLEDLQPEGRLEELCVERAAIAYWHKRRAQRAETGEIVRYRQREEATIRQSWIKFADTCFFDEYPHLQQALAGASVSATTLYGLALRRVTWGRWPAGRRGGSPR